MHEYAIAREIINMAGRHAEQNGAVKVVKINLVSGEYSGYVAENIALYFDIIAENTICEGAELSIKKIKPKLRCEKCEYIFEREPFSFKCPVCGGEGWPDGLGDEFYIESIVING